MTNTDPLAAALAATFRPEQLDDLHRDAWRLSLRRDDPAAADWGTLARAIARANLIHDTATMQARREQPDQTPADDWRWLDNAPNADGTRCRVRAADQYGNPHRCNKPRRHEAGHAWLAELPPPADLTRAARPAAVGSDRSQTREGADLLDPDTCERMMRAALDRGDMTGVDAALRVMAVQDPRRAEQLADTMRAALTLADVERERAGEE